MLILFLPLYFCLVYPSPLFPLPFYSSFLLRPIRRSFVLLLFLLFCLTLLILFFLFLLFLPSPFSYPSLFMQVYFFGFLLLFFSLFFQTLPPPFSHIVAFHVFFLPYFLLYSYIFFCFSFLMLFFLSFFSFPFHFSSSFASYQSLSFTIISLTLFLVPTHLYCLYHNYSFSVFNRFAHPFFSFLSVLFFYSFSHEDFPRPPPPSIIQSICLSLASSRHYS